MIDLKAKVKQDDLTICSMASAFHRLLSWHPAGPDKSPPVMSPLPETPEPEYVDGEHNYFAQGSLTKEDATSPGQRASEGTLPGHILSLMRFVRHSSSVVSEALSAGGLIARASIGTEVYVDTQTFSMIVRWIERPRGAP